MKSTPLLCRNHARLHSDERGFSMVEAMVAGMILAIGAFAVAQSLQFGLRTTALARQRAAAESFANQQMEIARTYSYDGVALQNTAPGDLPTHSTDSSSPDYWVTNSPSSCSSSTPCFDPDGGGPLPPEPIVSKTTSPYLIHHQTSVTNGNTTFTIDRYVTWVDSPVDGCQVVTTECTGPTPDLDTNPTLYGGDANGQDEKRVTIVVTWPSTYGTSVHSLTMSSLFSTPTIPYHGTTPLGSEANAPPDVKCPLMSSVGKTASFSAQVTDADGTVAQVDWNFGDGTSVQNGGFSQSHTYQKADTYQITNTAWDNVGASSDNASLNCLITVTNNGAGGDDLIPPTGSLAIAGGATYTTTAQVVLNLAASDNPGGSGVASMQFSDDGVNFGAAVPWPAGQASTTALYTVPSGDGLKNVYVKFIDLAGNVSIAYSDPTGIILDTTPPGKPTGVTASRTPQGSKVNITVRWSAPTPPPIDLAGYRVYRSTNTSGTPVQVGGNLSTETLSYVDSGLDASLAYTYCVVSFDNAGNESARACIGPI